MLLGASGLFPFSFLVVASVLCLLLGFLFLRRRFSSVSVFGCVAMVAACRYVAGAGIPSDVEVRQLSPALPLYGVELIGRIATQPVYYAYRDSGRGSWVFPFECEGLNLSGEWRRRSGRVQVRIGGAPPDLDIAFDDRLLLSGQLRKRRYPGGEPIEMAVQSMAWEELSGPRRYYPRVWGQALRERVAESLSKGIGRYPSQLAVYKALLLGYRKAVPSAINEQFSRTGTMHIFAISGLHVGMAGLFLTIVLQSIGVPRNWWGVWLLPLLLLYVVSTGMKSSALRAVTMASVYFLAPLFRRQPDVSVSIAFALILLLGFHPAEILSAGFIFSFIVVSFIVMGFSVVPEGFVYRGRGWLNGAWAYVASLGITSVAAFIASMPLTSLYFATFSPVSLFGNLIVVPLTFCIVLCGWLSIVLPVASEVFNYAALAFIDGLLGSTGWLAQLPGACWSVARPPLLASFLWYAGWILLLVHARNRDQRKVAAFLLLLALATALAPVILPG
ncbi:ComE operon protein 3 [Pontiella sulfatireligans]|uniref:ComE operon protein 3 n=2 Tax=Pontiella sulfatireligans TaxID=2750658 RepID=A0A6C2ULV2_9BACT|nr:ComE operon protein 3 [Pontiella sulfatireligans]